MTLLQPFRAPLNCAGRTRRGSHFLDHSRSGWAEESHGRLSGAGPRMEAQ
jgi:hypothetical protein